LEEELLRRTRKRKRTVKYTNEVKKPFSRDMDLKGDPYILPLSVSSIGNLKMFDKGQIFTLRN